MKILRFAITTALSTHSLLAADVTVRVTNTATIKHEKMSVVANARFIDDHRVVALTDLYELVPDANTGLPPNVARRLTLMDFHTGNASDFIQGLTYPVSLTVFARQGADGNRYVIAREAKGPAAELLKADPTGALLSRQRLERAPRDYYIDAAGLLHYVDVASDQAPVPLVAGGTAIPLNPTTLASPDQTATILMPTDTDIIRLNAEHQVSDLIHLKASLLGSLQRVVSLMPNGRWLSAESGMDQAGSFVADVVIYDIDGTLLQSGLLDAINQQLVARHLIVERGAAPLRPIATYGNRVAVLAYTSSGVTLGVIAAVEE